MTPEEKAKELYDKFYDLAYTPWHGGADELPQEEAAKEIATIAVDEIINQLDEMRKPEYTDFWHGDKAGETVNGYFIKEYWESVKEEIQKL